MSKPQDNIADSIILPPMHIWAYHRTKYAINSHTIAHTGFSASKIGSNGSTFGGGFYLSRDLNLHIHNTNYGNNVIKSYVDMTNVLILDAALSQELHGKPVSIIKQVYDKGFKTSEKKHFSYLKNISEEISRIDKKNSSFILGKLIKWEWLDIINLFDGVAYTGRSDGPCVVMYEHNKVFPVSFAHLQENYSTNARDSYLKICYPNIQSSMLEKYSSDFEVDETELNNYIIQNLKWKKLNQREVQKVRSGLKPRFIRLTEMLKKNPVKASVRLNGFLAKINYEHFNEIFESMDSEQLDFVNSIMNKESVKLLANMIVGFPNPSKLRETLRKFKSDINWYPEIFDAYINNFLKPKIQHYLDSTDLKDFEHWIVNWDNNKIMSILLDNMCTLDYKSKQVAINPMWLQLIRHPKVLENDKFITLVAKNLVILTPDQVEEIEENIFFKIEDINWNEMLNKPPKKVKSKAAFEVSKSEDEDECEDEYEDECDDDNEDECDDDDDDIPPKRKSKRHY